MLRANDTIGPYTLLRRIGWGGFGEVWLAERRSSLVSAPVALKLPLIEADALEAVRLEAGVWLRASGHPNVVPFLDADVYDGQVVLASEYIAGGSLAGRIESGTAVEQEEAAALVGGILAGLDYLHRSGIIHRDLKPDNVLLQEGAPRLADFGLARLQQSRQQSEHVSGTLRYMAPECFSGSYSVQSDLWAVGILLHELLTGSHPIAAADPMALLATLITPDPVPLSDRVPDRFRPLLSRLLAKQPSDRYASASAAREALQSAMRRDVTLLDTRHPTPDALPPHNLPAPTSSFIGREREIEAVCGLLASHRLVTLTGSGGCGKTRLMMQAAERLLPGYPQGVRLAELAALTEPDSVVTAVAVAVGVKEQPGQKLQQTLIDFLKSRSLLLVLDNCEHLLAAAADLTDALLRSCPQVRVLASSREALGLPGEQSFRVPSLSLPASDADVEGVLGSESARLFIERAQAVAPGFAVDAAQAPLLASIVRRLDGIPLAIELAAARIRALSLSQLSTRLDERFRLLTGGARTALPRQQTLRAMIDWSANLLSDQERALFRRLSVFAGGWTLEAAEQVCAGDPIEAWEVLDLLTALVDKSLAETETREGATRYRYLETVRQYAREQFAGQAGSSEVRDRHAAFFVALAEEANPHLQAPRQIEWLRRLDAEHENLQAAFQWSEGIGDSDACLRLCGSLHRYWGVRGLYGEGRDWCASALAHDLSGEHSIVRASALSTAGNLAHAQSEYSAARTHHEEALAIRREIGDRHKIGNSLTNLGLVAQAQGDYATARAYHKEAAAIFREVGDRSGLGIVDMRLGNVALTQGDIATARVNQEEAAAIFQEIGDRNRLAGALNNLGGVSRAQGDYATARAYFKEAAAIFQEIGDRGEFSKCCMNLGNVAHAQGDYAMARAYSEEAAAIFREIGVRHDLGGVLAILGRVALAQGDYSAAREHIQEAARILRKIGNWRDCAEVIESVADFAMKTAHPERAALQWGAAEALREAIGAPLEPNERAKYEQAVAEARAALGEEAFAAAWERGRAMSMEEAVAMAMERTP